MKTKTDIIDMMDREDAEKISEASVYGIELSLFAPEIARIYSLYNLVFQCPVDFTITDKQGILIAEVKIINQYITTLKMHLCLSQLRETKKVLS